MNQIKSDEKELMHPFLHLNKNKIEGLAFIGINLSRNNDQETFANSNSITRQKQFNFDVFQDRNYKYFAR